MFVIAHVRGLRQQLTTILRTLPKVVDIMVRRQTRWSAANTPP